jgi:hypothetical protein
VQWQKKKKEWIDGIKTAGGWERMFLLVCWSGKVTPKSCHLRLTSDEKCDHIKIRRNHSDQKERGVQTPRETGWAFLEGVIKGACGCCLRRVHCPRGFVMTQSKLCFHT